MKVWKWVLKKWFYKDAEKLKDLKTYFKGWQKSSLEAQRSDFPNKKWSVKEENAKERNL